MVTLYEVKTTNVYAFVNYENNLFIVDDSLKMKRLKYDSRSKKLKVTQSYDFSPEQTNRLKPLNYSDQALTQSLFYMRDKTFVYYGSG